MELEDMREIIRKNNLTLNSKDDSVIPTKDILNARDEISKFPSNSIVAQEFVTTIEKLVTEFLDKNSELDLIGVTGEFVQSLKNWLDSLEKKINELKSENNPEKNEKNLIHLYYYRKNLRELLKYL